MLSFNLGLLLVSLTGTVVVPEPFRRPGLIRWGASAVEIEGALAAESAKLITRDGDRPTPTGEVRIDCEGLQFRHRGRHAQFVLRGDRLVMARITVEGREQEAILRDMRKALGEPTHSNGKYIAFEGERTAWRFDPAEILFYSPEFDEEAAGWFR